MLERAGFKDVSVKVLRNDYPLAYWFKLLPIGLGLKKKLMGGLRMTRLGKLVIPVWAGNLVAVGYKPRQSERATRS